MRDWRQVRDDWARFVNLGILREKLLAALRPRFSSHDARSVLVELAWLAPLCILAVVASDQMRWVVALDGGTLKLALVALIVPALGEELLFRVAMLPMPEGDARFPWLAASLSILAFILWHPLQATFFGGARAVIFLDPWFLVAVAGLGIACTRLYWKTGSVWPPVALHWLVVVGWKAFAGGPPLV